LDKANHLTVDEAVELFRYYCLLIVLGIIAYTLNSPNWINVLVAAVVVAVIIGLDLIDRWRSRAAIIAERNDDEDISTRTTTRAVMAAPHDFPRQEQEWLQATDPQKMLEFLRGKASDRKFRLFAVACWRRVSHPLTDKQHREAVEIGEQFADGLVSDSTRQAFWEVLRRRKEQAVYEGDFEWASLERYTQSPVSKDVIHEINPHWLTWHNPTPQQSRDMCRLLRDVFGPLPFRPISIDPTWLTWHNGLLVSMAQQMYDRRDFSDMPVLADALEEAGCANQDILGHCRSGGEHVRGCWVVDLLLEPWRAAAWPLAPTARRPRPPTASASCSASPARVSSAASRC
jgi:hypothetical protein